MKSWFTNFSIRLKLTFSMLLLAFILLVSSSTVFFIRDVQNTTDNLKHTITTVGTLLAIESASALIFDDALAAEENLKNLERFPSIITARIFLLDGTLFASYTSPEEEVVLPIEVLTHKGNEVSQDIFKKYSLIHFNIPIKSDDNIIGFIHLVDDKRDISRIIRNHIQLTVLITCGLFVLAFIGAMYLARMFSGPIQRLSNDIAYVANNHDYGHKTKQESGDEVGKLVGGFNHLLEQLEERENELADYRHSLEEKVQERTAQIKEEKERAELANLAKSQFLASMSHEIRTPMNGILGMADLLAKTKMGPRQQEFLTTIRDSGESLLVLISDILDLSKIESGKIDLETAAFEPGNIVEQTLGMFAAIAREKQVELVSVLDPTLPGELLGDMQRIRQVLTNLVGNAVKFTNQGQIVVTCSAHTQNKSCQIMISVQDSGIGIDEQSLETIFDSFSQADGSTTRKYGGTGLGLSISRQLMQLMGGTLTVTSSPGKGATFTMQLIVQLANPQSMFAENEFKKLHIAVVDDNEQNRLAMKNQLHSWGATVQCFANGEEAQHYFSKSENDLSFDAMLIDRKMPGISGVELARSLRNQAVEIPALLLLTCVQESENEEYNHLFNELIFKPVRRQQLHDTILYVLGHKKNNTGSTEEDVTSTTCNLLAKGNLQLLVAEDSKVNRDVISGMFEDFGLRADFAEDGIEAIKMYKNKEYDFIFMDCQMPFLDGYDTTRQIRKLESGKNKHTAIVALTANALIGDRQIALDAGMDDYIAKPFRQEQLVDMIYLWTLGDKEYVNNKPSLVEPVPDNYPLDLPVLRNYTKMSNTKGISLLDIVIDGFLENGGIYLNDLDNAISDDDCSAVAAVAHKFKSAAGQSGGTRLMNMLIELEQKVKEAPTTAGLDETIRTIKKEYNSVIEALPNVRELL